MYFKTLVFQKMSDYNSDFVDEDSYSSVSATYSDQLSSDVEEELYSSVHHSSSFLTGNSHSSRLKRADLRAVSLASSNFVNLTDHFDENEHIKERQNELVNVKKSAKSQKQSEFEVRQNVNAMNLFSKNSKMKTSTPYNKNSNEQSESMLSDSDDSNSSSDVFCIDDEFVDEKLMTNLKDFSECDDDSLICVSSSSVSDDLIDISSSSNESLKIWAKVNKTGPVMYEDQSSSNEDQHASKEILSRSLPIKLQNNRRDMESESNLWNVSIEDLTPRSKYAQRFFSNRNKFCSKERLLRCYICGDYHKSSQCQKKVCGCCFETGHSFNRCPNKKKFRQFFCGTCKAKGHVSNSCPDLWRRYHGTTSCVRAIEQYENYCEYSLKFCFNCGLKGHLGQDCSFPKPCPGRTPSSPFIFSYKKPKRTVQNENPKPSGSNGISNDNNRSMLSMAVEHVKTAQNSTLTEASTSMMSESNNSSNKLRRQRKPWKKKKLVYEEQDFSRTPNNRGTFDNGISRGARKRRRYMSLLRRKFECVSQSDN